MALKRGYKESFCKDFESHTLESARSKEFLRKEPYTAGNVSLNDETDQSKRMKHYRTVSHFHQTAFLVPSCQQNGRRRHSGFTIMYFFIIPSNYLFNFAMIPMFPYCSCNIVKQRKTTVLPPLLCSQNWMGKWAGTGAPHPCIASFSYSRPRLVVQT